MRLRLLAFFPLATGFALLLLFSASSFVSAVEQSGRSEQVAWIPVSLLESECGTLYREIHALSHEISSCGEDPLCLGTPILCAGALDSSIDREYERLRTELNERCGVPLNLMDYAWGGPAWGERARRGAWAAQASSQSARYGAPHARHTPHAWIGRQGSRSWSDSRRRPNQCGAAHDWLEAASSGESEASQFFF